MATKHYSRRAALRACAGLAGMPLVAPAHAAPGSARVLSNEDPLSIQGNLLLRAGQPVRLNGVAVGDPVFVRKNRTLEDYKTIASEWQANVVRISLHPCHWQDNPAQAFEAMARDITGARANGLIVIIDWHAIGFPGGYVERPDPAWGLPQHAYQSDVPLALSFWREMALSFGRDPGIIFELWNEPVIDDKVIRSTGQHWPTLKALWLKLLGEIRRSSNAIVLASGGRFAHDLKGVAANLIEDDRVAYAWHCYPLFDHDLANRWHNSLDGLPQIKPVFVTEWGFCRDCEKHIRGTPEGFGQSFKRDCLDRYGLHSTAWVWSPSAGPAMLTPEGPATEFGQFVKQQIAQARAFPNQK